MKNSLLCLLLAALCCWASAAAAEITVFAAASLKEALDAVSAGYSRQAGDKVVISYAASSTLARQIENGAPADVFLSADLDWMDYLQQRQLIEPATRRQLLGNQLVLIAPIAFADKGAADPLKIAPNFALAAHLGRDKLAMANPDSVPAGKYGKAALQALGVWPAVEKQVVRAANVRNALLLVARGEARYGIVYRTDALAEPKVRIVDTFPANSHAPIIYPMALIAVAAGAEKTAEVNAGSARKAAARRFAAYLQGPQAAPLWQKFGFTVLD
jgi:molybdate transport system substrate-binding protein